MTSPREVLKRHFGYEDFRDQQETIIQTVLDGRSAFVLMPTGGGKSLCYQVPALLSERVTVVVSPLIALMKDQVDALRMNGIVADYLNSALSAVEQAAVIERVRHRETRLLYVAPERLFGGSDFLRELLQRLGPGFLDVFQIRPAEQESGSQRRVEFGTHQGFGQGIVRF